MDLEKLTSKDVKAKKYNNKFLPNQGLTKNVYDKVMDLKTLSAKSLYIYLTSISDLKYGNIIAETSYEKIRKELGIGSNTTITNALKLLEENELIEKGYSKGKMNEGKWERGHLKIILCKEDKVYRSVSYRWTMEKEIWDAMSGEERNYCYPVYFYIIGPREEHRKIGNYKVREIREKFPFRNGGEKAKAINLISECLIVTKNPKGYGKCLFTKDYVYSPEVWRVIRPDILKENKKVIEEMWYEALINR